MRSLLIGRTSRRDFDSIILVITCARVPGTTGSTVEQKTRILKGTRRSPKPQDEDHEYQQPLAEEPSGPRNERGLDDTGRADFLSRACCTSRSPAPLDAMISVGPVSEHRR